MGFFIVVPFVFVNSPAMEHRSACGIDTAVSFLALRDVMSRKKRLTSCDLAREANVRVQ